MSSTDFRARVLLMRDAFNSIFIYQNAKLALSTAASNELTFVSFIEGVYPRRLVSPPAGRR